MARLACCVLALLLVLINVAEARPGGGCGKGMKFRKAGCRTELSMFKRLLEDLQKEEGTREEGEKKTIDEATSNEEADLRALLYGDLPEERPAAAEKRTETRTHQRTELEEKEYRLRKLELEVRVVGELLQDLENNFDLGQ